MSPEKAIEKTISNVQGVANYPASLAVGVVLAGLTATESGFLPTPANTAVIDLDKRLVLAEATLSDHRTSRKELKDLVRGVQTRTEDNRELLNELKTDQAVTTQKIEQLERSISRDLDKILKAVE